MTVPLRPSSSESLELGKVESSQWLLLHGWSVGASLSALFLEPGQKCLLFWILLRSGVGGTRPPLESRADLLSSPGAFEAQSWSPRFGLSLCSLPSPGNQRSLPSSQQDTLLYLNVKALLLQWHSCWSSWMD